MGIDEDGKKRYELAHLPIKEEDLGKFLYYEDLDTFGILAPDKIEAEKIMDKYKKVFPKKRKFEKLLRAYREAYYEGLLDHTWLESPMTGGKNKTRKSKSKKKSRKSKPKRKSA